MVSDLGAFTGVANSPNSQHASSLSPAANPTLTTIAPTTAVSGSGTTALTAVTGTNFTPQSVVYANGIAIPTVFVSKTTLTATMPKKATAGTWPITVVTGGVVTTTAQTFTWT
jgi:alcohol dehydrogenase class IV